MAKIALTGIKPTGTPHLGNYLGMIKPALELAQSFKALENLSNLGMLEKLVRSGARIHQAGR